MKNLKFKSTKSESNGNIVTKIEAKNVDQDREKFIRDLVKLLKKEVIIEL